MAGPAGGRSSAWASFGDSAYYTHAGGAGVFKAGTMRWVEAIFGDRPRGISAMTSSFVQQVTVNVLGAFADGPAAAAHPARDNLDATREYSGDPIGSPPSLELAGLLVVRPMTDRPRRGRLDEIGRAHV